MLNAILSVVLLRREHCSAPATLPSLPPTTEHSHTDGVLVVFGLAAAWKEGHATRTVVPPAVTVPLPADMRRSHRAGG